jgi:hypothetical protein
MKSAVVEGKQGFFPDPIARVLRAIGRCFTGRRGEAEKSMQDVEAGEPRQDRAQPR